MATDAVLNQVVILTEYHSISGELELRDHRLSDFLNDRRESTLHLLNSKVARLNDPGKVVQQQDHAIVLKAWVVIIFEPPQPAIPFAKRLYGYVRKQQYEVFLVLEGMEVRGTLHTPGDLDLKRFLATMADGFLPITQATVTLFANDRVAVEQDAILVNARLIRYIAQV
jgi:hypothetical protein